GTVCQRDNAMLGEGIYPFARPAVPAWPGSSPACRKECYARRGRFIFLERQCHRYLEASRDEGFAAKLASEIRRRWVACVRIHVSGDFYSAEYVRKWVAVAKACPGTRFFAYT